MTLIPKIDSKIDKLTITLLLQSFSRIEQIHQMFGGEGTSFLYITSFDSLNIHVNNEFPDVYIVLFLICVFCFKSFPYWKQKNNPFFIDYINKN